MRAKNARQKKSKYIDNRGNIFSTGSRGSIRSRLSAFKAHSEGR